MKQNYNILENFQYDFNCFFFKIYIQKNILSVLLIECDNFEKNIILKAFYGVRFIACTSYV